MCTSIDDRRAIRTSSPELGFGTIRKEIYHVNEAGFRLTLVYVVSQQLRPLRSCSRRPNPGSRSTCSNDCEYCFPGRTSA